MAETIRDLSRLHPKMKAAAETLLAMCKVRGLNVLVTETFRTTERQDELYAQGRTAPGSIVTNAKGTGYQSGHQWGVAFDFCKNIKGQEYGDAAFFKSVGALGKSIGLFWGGDFKTSPDTPHFEMPEFMPNNSTSMLKSVYGTPEKFVASWAAEATEASKPVSAPPVDPNEPSAWAKVPAQWCKSHGYTEQDGSFVAITDGKRPKDNVKREELWTMLYRFHRGGG